MSDNSSLSSLSDNENPIPLPRVIRNRSNPFENLGEEEFKIRFRFDKHTVMEIVHQIDHHLKPMTLRNKSISSLDQLLVTLRFYATGAFQKVIGDTMNISQTTVNKIIHKVTRHIALLKPRYIKMPTHEDLNEVMYDFFTLAGFPRVVGAIDCTHIKITSPGGNNSEMYRNRKGYFSINVQMVCDAHLKIRHIIARWPGSVHDSTIFNDSPLRVEFEEGIYGNSLLLGDSGYPCKNYLLTPFVNPQNPHEEAYNRAHIKTRNTIERCFGVLKRRFPCLHVGMALKVENVLPVVVACAVLHNMAMQYRDDVPVGDYDFVEQIMDIPELDDQPQQRNQNNAVRNSITSSYF